MGVTPQAASNQVKQLERWVGVRLFNRTTRKISLTEEGVSFYGTCVTAVDAIDEGVRNLHDATEEAFGKVAWVAAPYGICWRFIAPSIGRFLEQYPRVSVELIVQNQVPDLVAQSIDVGVLGDPLPENSMVARRIGTVQHVLCATPAYLKRHGTPRVMEDLKRHRCINLRNWITGQSCRGRFRKATAW